LFYNAFIVATAYVPDDFEDSVNGIVHFAIRVANDGKRTGSCTKEDWKTIFNLPFRDGVYSFLTGFGKVTSQLCPEYPETRFADDCVGSTFRQFAVNLAATDPAVVSSWAYGQLAYEAAVELLGSRNTKQGNDAN
jgi:hypothetical protein